MGRDKPKKYNKMNFQQKSIYNDKLAKKYNINKDDFNTAQGGGGGRYDNIDDAAYEKAIKNAMRNDFDYRTSAQHMDGVKGNAKINDFTDYERAAVKLHKQAGNEGEYSSDKDITGVTNNLVNDYRRDISDKLDSVTNDINGVRDDIELTRDWKAQAATDPQRFEHSDPVAQAQANLDKYKLNLGGRNLFSKENEPASRSDDQLDATRSFAGNYITDVKVAGNVVEAADNLKNAAKTVISYRK